MTNKHRSRVPHGGSALAAEIVALAWNGVARTGTLAVPICFHALWNAPLSLFDVPRSSPLGGLQLPIVQLAIVVAWPYLPYVGDRATTRSSAAHQ